MISLILVMLVLPVKTSALTASVGQPQPPGDYSSSVYFDQSAARDNIDQACYTSSSFWDNIDQCLPPKWKTDKRYKRFRGFCRNLQTEPPGKEVTLPNGQQLLAQYIFPGIDEADGVHRSAYPVENYPELQELQEKLRATVSPVAQTELHNVLQARPLVNDDQRFDIEDNDGDTWQRAAWYGWQFLSLRGAARWMPHTTSVLHTSMRPAHRFVGLSRQRPHCTGTVHSDGRNYMLSTLTPLHDPEQCGIIVNGIDASLHRDPVILDNTFPHHIYNKGDNDRFCLMAECWHPALTKTEREALSILFAAKDRFTVLELSLAPWGYDDDSLAFALESGAVHDLNFWRNIQYDRNCKHRAVDELVSSSGSRKKWEAPAKRDRPANKGFGTAPSSRKGLRSK